MTDRSGKSVNRYSGVAILLHWLVAVLIIGQLSGGVLMVKFLPKTSSLTFEIYQLHKSIGILILILSMLRLLWRLGHQPPAHPETMASWERGIASLTHITFYGFMIVIPLIGWAIVSVSPLQISTYLFDTIRLPHLPFWEGVADTKALEDLFKWLHEYLAFAMAGLLALHIGAALKHHFKDRDNVLVRMLPILKQRNS